MPSDAGERSRDTVPTLQKVELIAGGVAHDLNNLLQTMRTRIDLAVRAGGLSERQTQHLEVALRCAREAETLSTQLRVLARGGAPRRETVDLQALVERALARYFENGRFTHELRVAPEARTAMLDAVQVGQVFDNLLVNARQAMVDGGRVRVDIERVQDAGEHRGLSAQAMVRVRIADDGPGIAPEALRRIFEPSFTTKPEGTGMGLAICQGVVRRHGGHMSCESEVGLGTTFTITLPQEGPAQ